jgi:hypothetical protein
MARFLRHERDRKTLTPQKVAAPFLVQFNEQNALSHFYTRQILQLSAPKALTAISPHAQAT